MLFRSLAMAVDWMPSLGAQDEDAMGLQFIDHYTIKARTEDLPQVVKFYEEVLGLHDGERPPFDFPGNWLYADGKPVVHLVGTRHDEPLAKGVPESGRLDHISFRCTGFSKMREYLVEKRFNFEEAAVPSSPIYQLFVRDPAGILVELTYDRRAEGINAGAAVHVPASL